MPFEHAADVQRIRDGQLTGHEAVTVLRLAITECDRANDAAADYATAIEQAETVLIYGPAGRHGAWEVLNPLPDGAAPPLSREELERSIVAMHEGDAQITEEEWQAFVDERKRRGRYLDVDESAAFLKSLRATQTP
jgi:hypothetical protein